MGGRGGGWEGIGEEGGGMGRWEEEGGGGGIEVEVGLAAKDSLVCRCARLLFPHIGSTM